MTAGLDNPYDIAKRLESHLRGYPYNDQIPGPAPGQDGVDYFLFEEQQGYCNYYASSMVVMLRYLGIPARLAVGYASGEYQQETGQYRLRNNDAHTWVEVYFPTYGWIEFEPTSSEEVPFRPSGVLDEEDDGLAAGAGANENNLDENRNIPLDEEIPDGDANPFNAPTSWLGNNAGSLLLIGTLLGILLLALWSIRRMQKPQRKHVAYRTVPPGFTARLWQKLIAWSHRLGLTPNASLTPLEQAAALGALVPDAAPNIASIADLYTRDRYSPRPISTEEAGDAQFSWLTIRPLFWKHWLKGKFKIQNSKGKGQRAKGKIND